MAVSRPLLAQRAGVGAEVRGSPSGASHRGGEVEMAEEVLAGMAEDLAEDSEEASAVVAEGSQVDRATEEATMAGEVRGEQAAPAATGAASGATAGGREACGPIAKVHNQEHVAVFFWFSILFFLLMCFVLSHWSHFFASLLLSLHRLYLTFWMDCNCSIYVMFLCILYKIYCHHLFRCYWPSHKEGAQVYPN